MFKFGKSKKEDKPAGKIENAAKLIELLGCSCEYFPKGTEPSKVINAYEDMFAKREIDGCTPLIITTDDMVLENLKQYANTHEELIANCDKLLKAPPIDAQKWFTEQLGYWKNELGDDWNVMFGEFGCENGDVQKFFSGFMDFGKPRKSDECIIAKIPTNEPWEVFAWLPFGGWNECPDPEVILRIAEYFYKRYRAIPAVMTGDILEFSVPPVKDKDTAIGAALEQYAFCSDIVDQGVGTIERLAGGLMESSVWYFWWD